MKYHPIIFSAESVRANLAGMKTRSGEWWDYSWNVAPGCTKVSEECTHCWALAMARRLQGMGKPGYEGLVTSLTTPPPAPPQIKKHHLERGAGWTGRVNLMEERLKDPLRLKRPRMIAVNLMGDLFHQEVPISFDLAVFDVMAQAYWHTFMVLTKRPERIVAILKGWQGRPQGSPLRNVWIGTTAGTQRSANERWSAMAWMAQQGWHTWVSSEPRLERINWHGWEFLQWMVTGGESGPYARPMAPSWARADRDWCREHFVAFWFKQWGEWAPSSNPTPNPSPNRREYLRMMVGGEMVFRFGRKQSGRMLDGRTWEDFPGGERR